MSKFKARLAVLLCIMLTLPTILNALPMTALETQAASGVSMWAGLPSTYENGKTKYKIQLEAGQKLSVADTIQYYRGYEYGYLSWVKGEKYTSSKKSVASVSSAGVLSAKKVGTATIKVKYKGASLQFKVQVVKKGSIQAQGDAAEYKKLAKKATALTKAYGSKITSRNQYKVLKAVKELNAAVDAAKTINYDGYIKKENVSDYGYSYYDYTDQLVIPELARRSAIQNDMYQYASKVNPTGTRSSKWFKISSVTAKKNSQSFTINLKKKVTSSQTFALDVYSENGYKDTSKSAELAIWVVDTKTKESYRGLAKIKKNSKKMVVTLEEGQLKSGRTYKLCATGWGHEYGEYGWTKGKKFKVK